MIRFIYKIVFGGFLLLGLTLFSLADAQDSIAPAPQQWTVDGVMRQAIVFAPASAATQSAPILFVFHWRGGTMKQAVKLMHFQTVWPDAIVVYPQALNTAGHLIDLQGKHPAWEEATGDNGDRDVKFFDAMLDTLRKEYKVDDKRIFVTGFSSGGGFSYVLWSLRGSEIAAVAPASAASEELPSLVPKLTSKPVFIIAGKADRLIKFPWQEATIAALVTLNGCGPAQPWTEPGCVLYPSKVGDPVLTYIHPAGHKFPPEAIPLVVKFFQEYGEAGP